VASQAPTGPFRPGGDGEEIGPTAVPLPGAPEEGKVNTDTGLSAMLEVGF